MLFFCFWPLHYIIIHWTHYLFSDWPKAYSEFSKWAPGTSSSCRLYNNHVKDTQGHANHVMYDRGAWFVRVIMSSSRALCCLPSVKKQKHDFQVCFVDRAGHRKNSWRQGHTKHKKSTKGAKELFADYVKEKKLSEPEEKKELTQTLKTYILCRSKKERNSSMYNKTIIRFDFCDFQNNQGLSKDYQPQPSASADNPYLDLYYSGYHKNLIQ